MTFIQELQLYLIKKNSNPFKCAFAKALVLHFLVAKKVFLATGFLCIFGIQDIIGKVSSSMEIFK